MYYTDRTGFTKKPFSPDVVFHFKVAAIKLKTIKNSEIAK